MVLSLADSDNEVRDEEEGEKDQLELTACVHCTLGKGVRGLSSALLVHACLCCEVTVGLATLEIMCDEKQNNKFSNEKKLIKYSLCNLLCKKMGTPSVPNYKMF